MGLPSKLKDFRVFADGTNYIGQIPEFTLPKIAAKMEAYRAGGMLGEVDIDLGVEKLEAELTAGGVIGPLIAQFGATRHDAALLRFAGAYSNESGQAQALEAVMRGRINEIDFGGAKVGSDTEHKYKYSLTYFRLSLDGVDLVEIDMIAPTFIVSGQDRYAAIRSILGG
jgi:uncharacterized protein